VHKHWTFRAPTRRPKRSAGVFETEAFGGRICPK
jgi:hypothetical protein